jgi:hypothetical protein
MEYKVLVAQPKQIDGRIVTGLAAITGNIDAGGDRIIRGAFKKTLTEGARRVRHLWMHDPYQPPTATIKELSEVGASALPDELRTEYPEATGGLQVVREYLDTPRGNEILEGIKAGAISEMSFGYDAVKFDFETIAENDSKGMQVRNLREVRLWDVSDVTWGMNQATVAAKLAPMLEAYKEQIAPDQYALLDQLVNTTQAVTGVDWLKAGRVLSARNLERLKNALDVLSEILLAAEPPEEDESQKLLALTEQLRRRTQYAQLNLENYLIGV